MKKSIFIHTIALLLLNSCNSDLTEVLSSAGENRTEFLAVIEHYSESDSLKLESAKFLIRNISDHFSVRSVALDSMTTILSNKSKALSDPQKEELWKNLSSNDKIEKIYDVNNLKSRDLISNIDQAFETWMKSPWKDDVSFKVFCDYILPHRVMNEMFIPGWREKLQKEYSHIISDETDLIKAYEKVHIEVMRKFRNHSLGLPYIAPLKDIGLFGTGSCIQGCVYETAVMRSLGIPTAIDGVTVWSNYSRNGHAWCALVLENATYTMTKHDTIASQFNIIDSSTFPPCNNIEIDYPYDISFKKRVSKITRNHYSSISVLYSDEKSPDSIQNIFKNQHTEDVSTHYFKGINLTLKSNYSGYIYLCIWRTNYGWYPVAYVYNENKLFHFKNLGDSILYLPVIYQHGHPRSIMNPILVEGGNLQILTPKEDGKIQKITIDRKISFGWEIY